METTPARLEAGIYAILNAPLSHWVLDTKDGSVVANPYTGSPSQQWKFEPSDGVSWSIQNVASGHYLGLPIDECVKNKVTLREVHQIFPWHVRQDKGRRTTFLLHIPYTKFGIHLDQRVSELTKTALYVHEDNEGHPWYLYKDLHLRVSSVLKDGWGYMIPNTCLHKAITVEDNHTVTYLQPDGREEGQTFQAVQTADGWAFLNIKTKQYLGTRHTVVFPDDSLRLSSVATEFTWMIIPHHGGNFQIWLPFTQTGLCLPDTGTVTDFRIHILYHFEQFGTPCYALQA
ncbi:hypothetical protein BKA70DRAFT_1285866 [Coprinopsis sp. MPI-PUGE-AT-0042]|nr:hypothetical protein BKA70DRAFT_1285866 [Coprinopsis sp. MPI-PUGE-AT-0042]